MTSTRIAQSSILSSIVIVLMLIGSPVRAAEDVLSDDGREVRLNDDGSWQYISTDRFATSADGTRVRLMEDGRWISTGEMALTGAGPAVRPDIRVVGEQRLELSLSRLVIETRRGKRSESHKSRSKKTQSVFTLTLAAPNDVPRPIELAFGSDALSIADSGGREYDIVNVAPRQLTLLPGEEATVVIRADGSPHWWTIKSMSLVIDKGSLASHKDIELTKLMSSARKRSVDSFE